MPKKYPLIEESYWHENRTIKKPYLLFKVFDPEDQEFAAAALISNSQGRRSNKTIYLSIEETVGLITGKTTVSEIVDQENKAR